MPRLKLGGAMYQSHLIAFAINRPADEVYAFLAEPRNFPQWAAVVGPNFRQIGPNEWAGDSASGERIVRFCERNAFGVLDHAVYRPGDAPVTMPMRVAANEDGCELTFAFYRRPGTTEAEFASGIEWVTSDFLALKSMLEA